MPQPSLRSLGRQLGLSAATVSLALRDSPRVIAATKRRVRLAARRAGYQPNVLVRSVMAAVRRSAHDSFQGALLAVNYSETESAKLTPYHQALFAGATRRANELGYSLDLSWVGPRHLSLTRLDGILATRNVHGVLVLPFAQPRDFSALSWSRLAAVMMDYCVSAPALHTVLPEHHSSIINALHELHRRGYRRPGMVVTGDRDMRVSYRWSAGFGSYWRGRGIDAPVPPLLVPELDRAAFLAWYRQHRPDVIIGHIQERATLWLAEIGQRIPRDVGFFQLNWTERAAPCAGLDLQPIVLGAAAVESIVAQLQRNEYGLPLNPKTTTLPARWVDGPTLRAR